MMSKEKLIEYVDGHKEKTGEEPQILRVSADIWDAWIKYQHDNNGVAFPMFRGIPMKKVEGPGDV